VVGGGAAAHDTALFGGHRIRQLVPSEMTSMDALGVSVSVGVPSMVWDEVVDTVVFAVVYMFLMV